MHVYYQPHAAFLPIQKLSVVSERPHSVLVDDGRILWRRDCGSSESEALDAAITRAERLGDSPNVIDQLRAKRAAHSAAISDPNR